MVTWASLPSSQDILQGHHLPSWPLQKVRHGCVSFRVKILGPQERNELT